jgi:hypothetical protein
MAVQPELREKFVGAKAGDLLTLQEGKLKFRLLETYQIQQPKAPEAPAAETAPAPEAAPVPAADVAPDPAAEPAVADVAPDRESLCVMDAEVAPAAETKTE